MAAGFPLNPNPMEVVLDMHWCVVAQLARHCQLGLLQAQPRLRHAIGSWTLLHQAMLWCPSAAHASAVLEALRSENEMPFLLAVA